MNTVIRKIGNSEGVIIPKDVLERLNVKAGDTLVLTELSDGLSLKPADTSFDDQMAAARKFMDKYKVALQKLAE